MTYINKNGFALLTSLLTLALGATGCAQGGPAGGNGNAADPGKNEPAAMSTEPVTLTVFNTSMGDELFKTAFEEPIKKKYPFITIQVIKRAKGSMIEDLVAAGNVPDILFLDSGADIITYKDLDVPYDMTPLAKKYNFDLSRIDPAVLDDMKTYAGAGNEGKLLALPRSINVEALFYNKDIFDKFGVPYPKDGMTWDDAVELAKKVTKLVDGVQYRGIGINDNILIPYNQLSLPLLDANDNAAVNTEQWKNWFGTMKRIYEMDGGKLASQDYGKAAQFYLKDKTLAMFASTTIFGSLPEAVKGGLNWDVVTVPTFKEAPGRTIQMFAPGMAISKTSKYKEQAFQAIAHILSDEVQTAEIKQGRMTVLKNQEIKKEYGKENPILEGKNREALIKNQLAPTRKPVSKYESVAAAVMQAKFKDVVVNDKDVNTALREAQEEINQQIAKLKVK
ncbi:hypothetical protein PAESOLCIP111_02477 [Paenibacillus solanacearum]|uniref:Extracellular solute-binding protein n=1 Tax=Paenibacillus solanacearum TaxID=2048548 RepID=A0A916NQD3_9BACL|nr:extracellular solute-binding protein [Paenibacillus solanacearum]CAG7623075.1 hypothetical protein PAESOLCIP111_02477 [Paenibacillus solanacearum]